MPLQAIVCGWSPAQAMHLVVLCAVTGCGSDGSFCLLLAVSVAKWA